MIFLRSVMFCSLLFFYVLCLYVLFVSLHVFYVMFRSGQVFSLCSCLVINVIICSVRSLVVSYFIFVSFRFFHFLSFPCRPSHQFIKIRFVYPMLLHFYFHFVLCSYRFLCFSCLSLSCLFFSVRVLLFLLFFRLDFFYFSCILCYVMFLCSGSFLYSFFILWYFMFDLLCCCSFCFYICFSCSLCYAKFVSFLPFLFLPCLVLLLCSVIF